MVFKIISRPLRTSPLTRSKVARVKIDEFVCPPNIPETVAVRIMKLSHQRFSYRLSSNEALHCAWAKGLFVQLDNQVGIDIIT